MTRSIVWLFVCFVLVQCSKSGDPAPVAVQRLCGICPVSHHLCAAKAVDRIVGGEKLTPTAEKMRRLMHYGQLFQSQPRKKNSM
jgi:coenzyme F420-reducing hydrogenase alpha subunit